MAAQSVTPFIQLAALLFSDRRPGDLSTREIILVLLGRILEIQPEKVTLPLTKAIWSQKISTDGSSRTEEAPIGRYVRKSKFVDGDEGFAREKEEKRTQAHELLRALLLGPPSEKEEAEHGFMKDVRRPRIFKLWVTEMSSITRDFYWSVERISLWRTQLLTLRDGRIFCHPNNVYNSIDTLDQVAIESPQVPSGMTGGVEYEAMHYCVRAHIAFQIIDRSRCISHRLSTSDSSTPSRKAVRLRSKPLRSTSPSSNLDSRTKSTFFEKRPRHTTPSFIFISPATSRWLAVLASISERTCSSTWNERRCLERSWKLWRVRLVGMPRRRRRGR